MLRNHSFVGALAFACTILSASMPVQPLRASDVAIAPTVTAVPANLPAVPPPVQQITQGINPNQLSPMANNVRPEANAANDLGRVADDFALEHMLLLLHRTDAQEQALDEFMAEQTSPQSPNFHNWLSADQFSQYGLAQSDLSTISAWLQSQGFVINQVHTNGVVIDFSGTAGQVFAAFKTQVHNLNVQGVTHFANMSVPQIPSALAPAVVGIGSINDFRPHTNLVPKTDYTYTSGSTTIHALVPADLATIYNLNPLLNTTPTAINGAGQTIALIEDEDPFTVGDITTFRSTFGLSHVLGTDFFYSAVHPSCSDPGDKNDGTDFEVELDVEYAGAAAPGAALEMVSCPNGSSFGGLIAMQNLLTNKDPSRLWSVSYGECEPLNGKTQNALYVTTYQQAAAAGISVFVASGDESAASCDADQTIATHGISVSGFTSTPYNVSVGGTDFGDTKAGTTSTYWNSTNTATFGSAKSYINEIPWNDSCASALIASAEGFATTYGSSGFCNSSLATSINPNTGKPNFLTTASGSGGPSGCATGSETVAGVVSGTCAGTPKPSWQTGFLGNPADGVRDIPDVSLFAANGVWGHYWVACYSNTGSGGAACTGAPSGWAGGGGTSFASPIMAGIQALINQKTNSSQGNPNPIYYSLASTEYGATGSTSCNSSNGNTVGSACIFYDVTQGDMDVNCTGTNNCYLPSGTNGVLSTSNSAYQPAYGTGTGWDFATGIGSVNATNLANNWPTADIATKLVYTTQPNSTYASGASITVLVSVENAASAVIATNTSAVTLALTGGTGGATLGGTLTQNAVAGVATFSNLTVDKVGTGYQLSATSPSLTSATSSAFAITAGTAKTVTFTTQPTTGSNISEGVTIPLVAHVVDTAGNAVSGQNITLAIGTNAGGSTLAVTTNPVTSDTSGNATFANVSLNKLGTGYTLTATDSTTPSATAATSNTFNIAAGTAKTVTFTTQPTASSNLTEGVTIPLVAHVVDAGGNALTGENITLAIGTNAGGSTLSVTTNPVATNASGDATFAGVSLNKVGTGYTLTASDTTTPAATAATSNAFNIVAGTAKTVTFTTQPAASSNVASGATIPLVVHVVDSGGNPVTAQSITLAVGTNPGGSALTVTTNPVATNASGDATFANVSLNKTGTGYTLTATDTTTPAATAATSNAFNITAGAASAISFSTGPSSATAGASISPAIVVHVQDASGNPVSADGVALAIVANPGGSTLSGGGSVNTDSNGNASFSAVSLNKAGTGYTLKATDSSAPALTVTSGNFNITAGAASSIGFSTQPSNTKAGSNITPAMVVHVQDANGNPVSADAITLSIGTNVGGSTLTGGAATNTNSGGDATFSAVSLNRTGNGYTLKATDSSGTPLTVTSTAFNITVGTAATVTFTTQPATNSNTAAGSTIALVAHVVDGSGNAVSGESITLAIGTNAGGSTLAVTTNPVVSNSSGDATFAAVSLNKVGSGYTLTASDTTTPAAAAATSNAFNIVAGAAKTVTFTTQPATSSNVAAGATIALVAHVVDASGNAVSGESISLAIGTNAGGSTLTVSSNPLISSASGDAVFVNVSLNKSGAGYTFTATDSTTGSATPATSNAFNIVAGGAAQLSFVQQPGNSTVGAVISPAITVQVSDADGNVVTTTGTSITLSANGPGPIASGSSAATVSGLASFNAVVLNSAGAYTLTASSTGLTSATSTGFTIGPANQTITFSTPPSNATVGGATYAVSATASSTLPVTLSIDATATAICSLTGSTVSFIGAGTCVIDAAQAGNANYNPASAQQSFGVSQGSQSINFPTPPAQTYSLSGSFALNATASSGLPVSYVSNTTGVCTVSSSTASIVAAGNCSITASQIGNENYTAATPVTEGITINPANQTVNFTTSAPTGEFVGGPTYTPAATATSGLTTVISIDVSSTPGACAIAAGVVSFTGLGTCNIDADQSGNVDFNAAPQAHQTVTVGVASQTIAFTSIAPAGATAGGTYVVTAAATSSLPVVLTIDAASSSVCSLNGNASGSTVTYDGVGTCTIDANQAGGTDYAPAPQAQQSFGVAPGAAAGLIFSTQPSNSVAGVAVQPAVTVSLVDAFGNVETGDSADSVTLALASGTDPSFTGGGPIALSGGIATFPSVVLTKAAIGYTLGATTSAGGFTATSGSFAIAPAAIFSLVFSPDPPPNAVAGAAIPGTLTVSEYDQFGNIESADNTSTISLEANGPGSLTTSPTTMIVSAGAASFTDDLVLDKAGDYTLTASTSASALVNATSTSFSVSAASGNQLQFTPAPGNILRGQSLGNVTVAEYDSFGNPVLSDNSTAITLTASSCAGTTLGTGILTGGVVTITTNLEFHTVATGVGLNATASGSPAPTPATSTFNVSANSDSVFYSGFQSCSP